MKAVWQGRKTPLQMGLRPTGLDGWLDSPCLFGDKTRVQTQCALKAQLLKTHRHDIFAQLPGSEEAISELSACISEVKGTVFTTPTEPELISAGRQVSDDLLLLAPDAHTEEWVLRAALLAFPSHWLLHEKIGRPMAEIHAPVPFYAERLESPVNRFFHSMQPDVISVRLNWTLQVGNGLFTPHPSEERIDRAEDIPSQLYLRAERQTFRKLTETGWIVFGIGTHIAPLSLWSCEPDALAELRDAVAVLSPEMKHYRGTHRYEAAFHKYVDSITR